MEKLHFTPLDQNGEARCPGDTRPSRCGEDSREYCHSVLVKLQVWLTAFLTQSSALSGATREAVVEDHREHCMLHSLPRFTPGLRMVNTWKEGWRWTMKEVAHYGSAT